MTPAIQRRATKAVLTVGAGRGFVISAGRRRIGSSGRYVVTAAHCLPKLPPAHRASSTEERTFARLLGPLGEKPTVWTECVFVDPIRDVAVLAEPDGQELFDEAEAYERLVFDDAAALRIADIPESSAKWIGGKLKKTERISALWMLYLDGHWLQCSARTQRGADLVFTEATETAGGMSGSPIVRGDGAAVGMITNSVGVSQPRLTQALPGWLLADVRQ